MNMFFLTCYLKDSVSMEVWHTLKTFCVAKPHCKRIVVQRKINWIFLPGRLPIKERIRREIRVLLSMTALCAFLWWTENKLCGVLRPTWDCWCCYTPGFASHTHACTDGITLAPAFCHNQNKYWEKSEMKRLVLTHLKPSSRLEPLCLLWFLPNSKKTVKH